MKRVLLSHNDLRMRFESFLDREPLKIQNVDYKASMVLLFVDPKRFIELFNEYVEGQIDCGALTIEDGNYYEVQND